MQRKGKRRRDLQYFLLGTYFRDLTLEMILSSQRREAGPHVQLAQLLLPAVIISVLKLIFEKLVFIHHLPC